MTETAYHLLNHYLSAACGAHCYRLGKVGVLHCFVLVVALIAAVLRHDFVMELVPWTTVALGISVLTLFLASLNIRIAFVYLMLSTVVDLVACLAYYLAPPILDYVGWWEAISFTSIVLQSLNIER